MGQDQRLVGVIQARMGSTRLPGKALADLAGRPVLQWVIEGAAPALDAVVVATTRAPEDAAIAACARACGAAAYAGSTDDVLSRVFEAAREQRATAAVRLTADCPFLDPAIVRAVLDHHLAAQADLTSNDAAFGGHPRGFDVEAIDMVVLEYAALAADRPFQREHVTPFLLEHPEDYRIELVQAPPRLRRPGYRVCVDTRADLERCRRIAARLGPSRPAAAAIVDLLDSEPALSGRPRLPRDAPLEAGRV